MHFVLLHNSNFPDIDYEAISMAYNLAIDLPLDAPLTQEQIASLPLTEEEKEMCSNIHWRNLANLLHLEERYRHISISIIHKSQKYSDEKAKAHKEEMDYELRGEISPAKAIELAKQKHTKQLIEEQENISREKSVASMKIKIILQKLVCPLCSITAPLIILTSRGFQNSLNMYIIV